jgi:tetratricopeptide (TPR) repeat protein
MFAQLRSSFILSSLLLVVASGAWAQTTTIEGDVKDANGAPLKGAVIVLDRTDIKGHYSVKSDKKGHWLYTGLPYGKFDISCQVDGQTVDSVKGVQSKYGDSTTIDFDMRKAQAAKAGLAQAAATGELPAEAARGMSKEEKEKFEATAKKNAETMKKNKALNDAFNGGQDAKKAGDAEPDKAQKIVKYQAAVDSYNKAGELDPSQAAVWDALGETYSAMGDAQTGDARTQSYDKAIENYNKGLVAKPNDAGVYNQIGNLYGKERKIPEATDALTKAAQLDPTMAPKAYFNMGANLVNSGQPEKATDFFKKAADADPTYSEAWYQYGSLLMMQGKVDPKTGAQTYPPDTATALKKYVELQPNGAHAAEANAMLQAMGEKVETKVNIPQPSSKKKK